MPSRANYRRRVKAKILLVDDYLGIRDSLGRTLRLEGYDVALASNGQEALNSLRGNSFDLVLLDLDMPVVNGWEVLSQIITISPSLPVIIITGCSIQEGLLTQKGAKAVLEKPLDLNLVLEVMEKALGQKTEARRQQIESGTFPPPNPGKRDQN